MKIPQSVFDGYSHHLTHAAADPNGDVWLFPDAPSISDEHQVWLAEGAGDAVKSPHRMNSKRGEPQRPADWWKHTLIEREQHPAAQPVCPSPAPLPIQIDLPQSVFNGAPAWVEWARITLHGVEWCECKPVDGFVSGRSQYAPPTMLAPISSQQVYIPTKRLQMPQTAQRQYGLPDPSVVTTKRTTLKLSNDQCEKLLIEAVLKHYPQMAGGNLSVEGDDGVYVITAEVAL
jgi:hypothetical protein